jgi:hypothetical protein
MKCKLEQEIRSINNTLNLSGKSCYCCSKLGFMVLSQVDAGGLAPQTPQQRAERRPPHLPRKG